MKAKIKRGIAWVRYYQLNLVLFAMIGWLIFIIIVGSYLALSAPESSTAAIERAWLEQFWKNEADPAWQAEQQRLHRKHGLNHVIIYEPGKAYYYNEKGQKCRFI